MQSFERMKSHLLILFLLVLSWQSCNKPKNNTASSSTSQTSKPVAKDPSPYESDKELERLYYTLTLNCNKDLKEDASWVNLWFDEYGRLIKLELPGRKNPELLKCIEETIKKEDLRVKSLIPEMTTIQDTIRKYELMIINFGHLKGHKERVEAYFSDTR